MGKIEVSQRRIDANRRNAMRSTGPRTEEGKAQSRRNRLIHGLAGAEVVVPEDEAQATRERAEQWVSSLRPMNAFEMGLVETIANESVRIDRCRIEERLVRDVRARRAGACWLDERRAEVAKPGKTLAGCPEEVAARLASTASGCDWMIVRWRALGKVLEKAGDWTDEQRSLALDLMGVDADLRAMDSPLDTPAGADLMSHLRDLVECELEGLAARQEEALDAIDDDLREAATMGLMATDDPSLVLLRRYETASYRRQRWALDMLHKGRQKAAPAPTMTHDYIERPRQVPYPYVWNGPVPSPVTDPDSTPPPTDPEGPTTGPGTGRDRAGHDPVPRSERPQPAPGPRAEGSKASSNAAPRRRVARDTQADQIHRGAPTQFADRAHLSGLLRRLARSLVAPSPFQSISKPLAMPERRRIRPATVLVRPPRPDLLRLVPSPAA
ncbi:hypothetical protein EP7_001373 [Isosphaeraceae bacterium EP7]